MRCKRCIVYVYKKVRTFSQNSNKVYSYRPTIIWQEWPYPDMSEEQIREFLIMCKDERMFAGFYLLLSTGLRRGELLGLKWGDIDFENGQMCIQRSLAKTNTQRAQFHEQKTTRSKRMIPLTTDVINELKKHKERQDEEKEKLCAAYSENGMFFCREDGTPIHSDVLDNRFHKILAKAGLPILECMI